MDFCRFCGILKTPLTVWNSDKGGCCRTCSWNQQRDGRHATPCGQEYCRNCGLLIKRNPAISDTQGYCLACESVVTVQQPEKSLNKPCTCDLCGNHYMDGFDIKDIEPAGTVSDSKSKCHRQTSGQKADRQTRNAAEVSPMHCFEYGNGITESVPSDWMEGVDWTKPNQYEQNSIDMSDWSCGPDLKGSHSLAENQVEDEIRNTWEREQLELKKKFIDADAPVIKEMLKTIRSKNSNKTFYIGGVDISFIKGNSVDACAALVVVSFPELKVVYRRLEMVQLTAPYIPGFLAFREADFLVRLYNQMLLTAPQYKPDVIFVDGNGQLHPREFGLACHLGVLLDIPCVGVAKTLIHVDGIEDNAKHRTMKQSLVKGGDHFKLVTSSGKTLGVALRSTDSAPNPIYVSVGHRISIPSAVTLVQQCCKYRIPEPTRHADMSSRQYLAEGKRDPEEFIA